MQRWVISLYLLFTVSTPAIYSAESGEPALTFLPGKQVGKIETKLITEASGIAASRKNPGILWVHNDSGSSAVVYALNTGGKLVGSFSIEGARCRDWEDIAIGPGPDKQIDYLYIGDIGDNKARYSSVTIYRVPEPNIAVNSVPRKMQISSVEKIKLVYHDGPKDAETLMVDPLTGDIYIISKRKVFCRVYHAPCSQLSQEQVRMEQVAVLPWALAVGGDISPDGGLIIVRSLSHASIWIRPKDKPLWQVFSDKSYDIKLMREPQGEGICFDSAGRGFFTVSEKVRQPIYYYAKSDEPKNN